MNWTTISPEQVHSLFTTLKNRFEQNMHRHPDVKWRDVQQRLEKNQDKLWSLNEMEETGGEPDVTGYDDNTKEYVFCDCSPESPKGRRSLCYDEAALKSRRENKPKGSALGMAREMGIDLLDEMQYTDLQKLGEFDIKTSSWIVTPDDVRERGGSLFGDSRYGRTFIYHNGAESYYASRGFRGILKV
ncbi:DUF4256 domain-containing protein [Proteiniphilum sp. UBA5510]|jgi:hypothetical protein|uniref:DUF4256 domain-containing protein n=1 Tax=Proteiniphilum sp. UBA5510 TaxID=1947286 RepID=UPI00257FED4D|nr:DUF4256 domain-containing protein [Proteiniphilum sp. UBA5510]MDD4632391.1 DUF4256 domain-containing protein [Proteiniphilum sp.]